MESRIPLPTDNIFKFYALFGLLLFIFSCGAFRYVNQSANDVVFSALPELEGLKQNPQPTAVDSTKIAVLQKRLEITKADKQVFVVAVGVLIGISFWAMFFGFRKWHELQPVLDRTAKAQMEIAELQLAKLRREMETQLPQGAQADSTEAAQRSGK